MKLKVNRRYRGFTLIELLVVILILAILMAVALPLYLNAVADSQLKTCRSNMQTISNAVQAKYVSSNGLSTYATIAALTVNGTNFPDLVSAPICPQGGTYSITATPARGGGLGYGIQCSYGGSTGTGTPAAHGEFDPGIDAT